MVTRAPYEEIEKLGAGSYGEVYLIKYNGQKCVGKKLHRLLLDPRDSGMSTYIDKFRMECERLKSLSHDCIVKYIDTTTRHDQLPVLIMELCGDTLTKFLEHHLTKPLPYHTEVNIGLDMARALEYLHENSIIHRDLTSNNVLMVAGNRVKVSDFGMATLEAVDPSRTLTMTPGNPQYMSPQAFSSPPTYTAKLDVFSFGVLLVQIVTRQPPKPSDRHQPIPGEESGVCREVPERERRSQHLDLIADKHPLKSVSLHCLQDEEEGRPTAAELVVSLKCLRGEEKYTQSYERELHRSRAQKEREKEAKRRRSRRSAGHRFRRRSRRQSSSDGIKLKLLLVGQSGVGKTCLLRAYNGLPCDNPEYTVGMDVSSKTVTFEGVSITLDIWDSAGQEQYNALTKAYFRGAQGVLVVYDVRNEESLKLASDWIKATHMNVGDVEMVLVGNKTDDEGEGRRIVSEMDGRNLAERHNIPVIETSAVRNENVQEAFNILVHNIMKKKPLNMSTNKNVDSIRLAEDVEEDQQRRSCCVHRRRH